MRHAEGMWLLFGLVASPVLAFAAATYCFGIQNMTAPPHRFELVLDDQHWTVEAGKATKLTIGDMELTATVRLLPTRLFRGAGMTFEFPTEMIHTVDDGGFGLVMYDLDSETASLQIMDFGTLDVDARQTAEETLEQIRMASEGCTDPKEIQWNLGGKNHPALTSRHDGLEMSWTVCWLQTEGHRIVLVLHDSYESGELESARMLQLKKLMANTLVWR